MEDTTFHIGEKFSSFDQLQEKISAYTRKTYIDLYRRESRTIATAIKAKRISSTKVINESLKYYEVQYNCIHGGNNFKSQGKGVRASSTFSHHQQDQKYQNSSSIETPERLAEKFREDDCNWPSKVEEEEGCLPKV